MKIILVRHAESLGNKEGRVCGTRDVSLSSVGKKQALKVGKRLEKYNIEKVICSPLKRTVETANAIVSSQDESTTFSIDEKLIEMYFGVAEGLTPKEYKEKYGRGPWNRELGYPNDIKDQETFIHLKERYVKAIEKHIYESKDKYEMICIVAHGMGIGSFMSYVKGKNELEFNQVKFSKNTAVTMLDYNFETKKYAVIIDADISHLD